MGYLSIKTIKSKGSYEIGISNRSCHIFFQKLETHRLGIADNTLKSGVTNCLTQAVDDNRFIRF